MTDTLEVPELKQASLQALYAKLFQAGSLVNLQISIWVPNIKTEKTTEKKDVLNLDYLSNFKNLESKARRILHTSSFDFPVSNTRFVPKEELPIVLKELDELNVEFDKLTKAFIENYEAYQKTAVKGDTNVVTDFPPVNTVSEKFSFVVTTFEITTASLNKKEDQINTTAALLTAQEAVKVGQLKKFAHAAILAQRANLVKVCDLLITKINENKIFSKANIKTIHDTLDQFSRLNFLNDKAILVSAENLLNLIELNPNFKSNNDAVDALNAMLETLKQRAQETKDIPTIVLNYLS